MNKLKHLFFPLLLAMMGAGLCPGEDELREPTFRDVLKNTHDYPWQLKTLLKEGKITEFYDMAAKALEEVRSGVTDPPINPGDIKRNLWVRYLIATAPFVDIDRDDHMGWIVNKGNLDYECKLDAIKGIYPQKLLDIDPETEKKFHLKRTEAINLFFAAKAVVLKQFRERYDPDFEEKKDKATWYANHDEKIFNDRNRQRAFFNRLAARGSRNSRARWSASDIEEGFIKFLVDIYPGKSVIAKKYIFMAGYKPEEVPPLLDRTIGRVPEAQYIYRCFPRRKDKD